MADYTVYYRENRCGLCKYHDKSGGHTFGFGWCDNPSSYYYEVETMDTAYCKDWEEYDANGY